MPASRKSVELSLKRQAIDWIATEGGGVPSRAEAHFYEILAATGSRRRLQGAGRRPVLGEAEDTLVDLIYDRRLKKEKVTRDWIAAQARLIFHESRTEEEHEEHPIRFAASDAWVTAFMQRNNLSLRRRTNLTTLTDEVLVDRAVSFMQFLQEHKPTMNLN
ncbi:hypothetical protein PC129_g4550 [Phytophthora cactorum]|uniref:HTH CENPB-type domain-containing protein n=1 Tax=Phytophthora cactorum TaxID=29920 RepID=A0A8T1IJ53_9STRA|nr:hypothetical protein PC114_g5029 [Phytophthora cactorum]KAG3181237.1 hypothetical protein C6341_g6521 [Phytophthora cactorum]KAG3224799.1 hypothetical protein PC129_g4550 [Phytophthora cactorum]